VETALRSVLVDMPQAAGIWLLLLAVAVVAAAALMAPRRRDPAGPDADPELGEAHRYADEIAVAAERAARTSARRRADWVRAEAAVDTAWRAFEDADRASRRAAAAAAFAGPDTFATSAEYAERERFLHRAATAACRRGELPVSGLAAVLAHRDGWDPARHPAAQQAALSRAVRDARLAEYREATAAERRAWQAADRAAAALRSLRDEAFAARVRAETDRPAGAADWLEDQLSLDLATGNATVPIVRGSHALAG
jgi:murein L,D-transpeptidase YcbB/YkuD